MKHSQRISSFALSKQFHAKLKVASVYRSKLKAFLALLPKTNLFRRFDFRFLCAQFPIDSPQPNSTTISTNHTGLLVVILVSKLQFRFQIVPIFFDYHL
jgi:hypothetical protein